ncbi:MAG: DinB family protein [Cyclobacteriaceae bacterium]
MKKHFLELFEYNNWANERILISIEEMDQPNEKLILLYSHLISAEIIWLNRIKDLPTSPFPLWMAYKLRELRTMTEESTTNWINYIHDHKFETFEEMIFYKNSKGRKYESTIREVITQVINHSTYHRGQIAMKMKEAGVQPPATDYIAFRRLN